ncbi:unnamed protein product [Durusdinium trenchii]|uniref:RRM domain-containing protein n=2 Tax=Durusdinium trenchii TaxID=1381693 RepID=A0ABP0HZP4_9DINO
MYGAYASTGYGSAGANYGYYHGGPMTASMPSRPPMRMLPGMDPATGVVWPGGKRPPGPMVKAGNLARDITIPALKQALSKWGVDGIKEVLLADSRFGQVALFLFKEAEQAQLMMMAQGVEVEGRPLMLEFLPAVAAKPEKKAREVSRSTDLIKVSGLPKKMDKNELVTHLRSHGVLGISQVALQPEHVAIIRFNEEKDVPKAISKAHNTVFKEKKLTLEPLMSHWDALFPNDADERGGTFQDGSWWEGYDPWQPSSARGFGSYGPRRSGPY